MPTECKHYQGACAEIVLTECPGGPRYEVDAYRADGCLIMCATDSKQTAEATYRHAGDLLERSLIRGR